MMKPMYEVRSCGGVGREREADGRRDAADDTRQDDERDAVAHLLFGDQLAEPQRDHRTARDHDDVADQVERVRPRDDALRHEQAQKSVRLHERERHGEQARVLVELRLAARAFLVIHLLHLREDDRHELHHDRGRDVRTDAKHHDRKVREAAAGEEVKEAEQLVGVEIVLERRRVHARDRDRREHAVRHQKPQHDEDLVAEFLYFEYL